MSHTQSEDCHHDIGYLGGQALLRKPDTLLGWSQLKVKVKVTEANQGRGGAGRQQSVKDTVRNPNQTL